MAFLKILAFFFFNLSVQGYCFGALSNFSSKYLPADLQLVQVIRETVSLLEVLSYKRLLFSGENKICLEFLFPFLLPTLFHYGWLVSKFQRHSFVTFSSLMSQFHLTINPTLCTNSNEPLITEVHILLLHTDMAYWIISLKMSII